MLWRLFLLSLSLVAAQYLPAPVVDLSTVVVYNSLPIGNILSEAMHIDNQTLYMGDTTSNTISIFSILSGEMVGSLSGHSSAIHALLKATDGYLYSCSSSGEFFRWNLSTMTLSRLEPISFVKILVQYTEDSLLVGGMDGSIHIFNVTTQKLNTSVIRAEETTVSGIVVLNSTDVIFSSGMNIYISNPLTGVSSQWQTVHNSSIKGLLKWKNFLFSYEMNGRMMRWNIDSMSPLGFMETGSDDTMDIWSAVITGDIMLVSKKLLYHVYPNNNPDMITQTFDLNTPGFGGMTSNGRIACGHRADFAIMCFDGKTPIQKIRYPSPLCGITVFKRSVYGVGTDGILYQFSLDTFQSVNTIPINPMPGLGTTLAFQLGRMFFISNQNEKWYKIFSLDSQSILLGNYVEHPARLMIGTPNGKFYFTYDSYQVVKYDMNKRPVWQCASSIPAQFSNMVADDQYLFTLDRTINANAIRRYTHTDNRACTITQSRMDTDETTRITDFIIHQGYMYVTGNAITRIQILPDPGAAVYPEHVTDDIIGSTQKLTALGNWLFIASYRDDNSADPQLIYQLSLPAKNANGFFF